MQSMVLSVLIPILWTVYLLLVNLFAIIGMWWDKRKARLQDWRVAEGTFFILSLIGGAIGIFVGMFKFRHKTQKRSFQAVVFIGFLVSLFIYYYVLTTWLAIVGPTPTT